MWGYRSRDVARMLNLSVQQVRGYVRQGLLDARRGPRGELLFSFHDLVLLRTASGLVSARMPQRRVRSVLQKLRKQLPEGRTLAGVRVAADGETTWQPESGQVLFDFEVSDIARKVAPLIQAANAPRRLRKEPKLNATQWVEWGCDLEDGAPDEAREAYRRALELDPDNGEAHLNLGRLLHESGDHRAAEAHYRHALAAAFNLGVALEDLGRLQDALEAYDQAIANDARFADAHYNAARIEERLGDQPAALRHWSSYRKLIRPS
jgi:tetratricopeptide (TPR) repeat protein